MLNPVRVRRSVFIRATPAEVWKLCQDPRTAQSLLPRGGALEVLTDRFDQVGSRWLIVTTSGKERREVVNEVVEIEPMRRQVVRSRADRMDSTSITTLTPQGDGTLLSIEATAEFPPGLQSIANRMVTAIVGPIATGRALKQLARLVELRPR